MTLLGITVLHLQIADFKFTHYFIIYDRLPDTETIFGIDAQKNSHYVMLWIKRRIFTYKKEDRFLTYTQNCEQKATIGIIKSTLKIPPRHNGIIPIKIKGQSIIGQTACFISDQESTKGMDPNINIVSGILNIKGKTSVNILVLNYSNKHVTFNKGAYVGHYAATIESSDEEKNLDPQGNTDDHTRSSVTTNQMMSEQVEPNAFEPPHHKLKPNIKTKLDALLK